MIKRLSALAFLLIASLVSAQSNSSFDQLVDAYFDSSFKFHPSDATSAGFHQYDVKLEDFAPASMTAEIADLKSFLAKFQAAQPKDETSQGDREIILGAIQSRLLELETIKMWEKDPNVYTDKATYAVFLLMVRNFAPQEERLKSVIAREREIPKVFEEAQKNLKNPPRIYLDVALQQLPGTIGFFRKDVPEAFSAVKDPKLLAEFKAVNQSAIDSLNRYQSFLQKLPANGDFRIGADNYSKKLLYEEMVDTPLDRLLDIGYADLHRNQERLKQVAAQIDPKRSPQEILDELRKDHPAADQLIPTFRSVLGGLRQFIEEKQIITIPSQVLPIVEETPPFQRALTTASMDTPGAYETKATEALFNVTPVEKSWSADKVEDWMRGFNRGTIISTAIHEAYPGHYVQFLWVQEAPSKARKLLYAGTNAEGWAHYCEQMMLDEGYGNGDPKLRIGQIIDALLRDSRYIAGIQMHTGRMTLEQARKFFVEEGYQTPSMAEVESKRGTSDPTYLMYTLGKLQIMKLREDYKTMKGDKFNLKDFHDQFMRQGAVPLKIIRKAMLGNDSPTL